MLNQLSEPDTPAHEQVAPVSDVGVDPRVLSWKAKYGAVHQVEVSGDSADDPPLLFYFRSPDRKIISAVAALQEKDQVAAAETMILSCILDGPREALDDVSVFAAVSMQLETLARPRRAAIKKL